MEGAAGVANLNGALFERWWDNVSSQNCVCVRKLYVEEECNENTFRATVQIKCTVWVCECVLRSHLSHLLKHS